MALVTDSLWGAIASSALIGTERHPFQVPVGSGALGNCLGQLGDRSSEAALLSAAATVALHQRVGWLPELRSPIQTEPCPLDERPRCGPRAARCLQQMLQGQYSQLLAEWLEKAAIAQQRVPEMLLPSLLDRGRQQRELRASILLVLGQRGRWLAAQNPDWSYALALATEEDWETGTLAARLLYLQDLRSHHPARARELLQSTWSQETAGDRTKFLDAFHTGLSLDDEPFLEMALGDRRSKEVRRVAAELLVRLPNSRLCQQMTEYIQSYISLSPESSPALTVKLPEALTPELIQLGIDPKAPSYTLWNMGEKAGWLLQMIGATPLSFWNDTWNMTAKEIVHLVHQHQWQAVLLQGWAVAAQRQGDRAWAAALLTYAIERDSDGDESVLHQSQHEALLNLFSSDERSMFLLGFLRSHQDTASHMLAIRLLAQSSEEWSPELTQGVLERLRHHFTDDMDTTNRINWQIRTQLKEFARFIPLKFLPDVLQLQAHLPENSLWQPSLEDLISVLQFRDEITQGFERKREGD